ncbi:unnamed protein product [Dibothriocephalus latus]|uniref:Peptidase M1 leukotriene A4 hydrolase/aminopeptidase C-terminal domain-containing protein n=1 Tax=Dibothriocephalus latus TaxID=60516 RepID=A0A3P7P3I3_DIBLA|nr:unnamed protein product [Dibothriocephalus latus]
MRTTWFFSSTSCVLAEFKEDHPFTKLVPCLDGVHTDDYFSIVPYQKGSLLLYFLEQKYGKPAMLRWLRAYLDHFQRRSLSTRSWLDFLCKQLGTDILGEVNWNEWLYKTGAIPWVPTFSRKLSTVCDSVVSAITKDVLTNDPSAADFVGSTYEGLVPLQRQLFLQRLLERVPIHHDNLRVLDEMLQISQSKNSEIRYRLVELTATLYLLFLFGGRRSGKFPANLSVCP